MQRIYLYKFFNISLKRILLGGSFLLVASAFISRIMGVYRDHLFARYFGVGPELDAYYAAFTIPDLLYALLITSSIAAVFLPRFQKYKANNNEATMWQFASSVINSLFLIFAILALLIVVCAPSLVDIYVANFSAEQKELTVSMIRIMMLSPLFFLFSSMMIAIENAFQKYFAQAMAPILYNVGIIFGVVFLSGYGIEGVAWGVILGAALQMLFQIPFFLKTGFSWSFSFLRGKELHYMLRHFWPRLLSASITHVSLAANVVIAAWISVGAITLYTFAFNIQSFTFGMIGVSLSIPAFALLTEHSAKNDMRAFQTTLQKSFEQIMFWYIPANVGLFLVAKPLVQLVLEYGAFTSADTQHLVYLVQLYALGLIFTGISLLLTRVFLAVARTWFVTFVSIIMLTVDIIASIFLAKTMGVTGLVWGTIIAFNLKVIILGVVAWKDFGKLFDVLNMSKIFLLSILMYAVVAYIPQETSALLQLLLSAGLGGFVYLLGAKILKIKNGI